MILTAGGDGASKGAQEVMQALAQIDSDVPDWRYVCKVWPQLRTEQQNLIDLKMADDLGIGKKVIFSTNIVSQNFIPYLLSACDIYAAPSRLEGFGMIQVEANACEKPVIAIDAMALSRHHGPRRNGIPGAGGRGKKNHRSTLWRRTQLRKKPSHRVSESAHSRIPGQRARHRKVPSSTNAGQRSAPAHGRSGPQACSRAIRLSPGRKAICGDRFRPIGYPVVATRPECCPLNPALHRGVYVVRR